MECFDFNFCWNRLCLNNLQSRCCNNSEVPLSTYTRTANGSVVKCWPSLFSPPSSLYKTIQKNHWRYQGSAGKIKEFKGKENELSLIYTFSLLLNLHLQSLKSLEMFPISFQIQIERRTVQKNVLRPDMRMLNGCHETDSKQYRKYVQHLNWNSLWVWWV